MEELPLFLCNRCGMQPCAFTLGRILRKNKARKVGGEKLERRLQIYWEKRKINGTFFIRNML